jgi:hypothetical protein
MRLLYFRNKFISKLVISNKCFHYCPNVNQVGPEKRKFYLNLLVIVHEMCYQNCRFFGNNHPKPCDF